MRKGNAWEDDALCREYDSSLWILSEFKKDARADKAGFEQAEVICSKCPVFHPCWHSASTEDKEVTMRAGSWPTDFRDPDDITPGLPDRECRNGHDLSPPGSLGKDGRCVQCRRDRGLRFKERKRLARESGKV